MHEIHYILSIDQSTSTTKALLFDKEGNLVKRSDVPHRQIINSLGWVEHDPHEILENVFTSIRKVIGEAAIDPKQILCLSLSNQRETSVAWDRTSGKAAHNAIVWQCGRAADICKQKESHATLIKEKTGLNLSPYFSAAKFAWFLDKVPAVQKLAKDNSLVLSTIDSFLLYHLSEEHTIQTEPSNASRTQLLNIHSHMWDEELCSIFGIKTGQLPTIVDSDAIFGHTTLGGLLSSPIPICGVLGDSQGALYAQGCTDPGMVKATYGTGSSIMMNIGPKPTVSKNLVTSIAWSIDGRVTYVLEGNINYTGATITWLVEDLKLLLSPKEAAKLAALAKDSPGLYLVPAFSGLGAPYWDGDARASITGMNRTTGKNELIRAAEESIAYQIADILFLMKQESGHPLGMVKVDGGPTRDTFLMQFQADIIRTTVGVASLEELSGQGPAILAGKKLGFYGNETLFQGRVQAEYLPLIPAEKAEEKYTGWIKAVKKTLTTQ